MEKAKDKRLYCKLSQYAKRLGITYRTAFNHFRDGKIPGAYKDNSGHICVPIEYFYGPVSMTVHIYVSCMNNMPDAKEQLEREAELAVQYCNARGYKVAEVITEITSTDIDEPRTKLFELLSDRTVKHIVVPYKSSVGIFAYNHVEAVLQADGRQIECMNVIDRNNEDLKLEYSKIIFAMCKKVGGNRISKRNIKILLDSLKLPDISHLI